MKRAFLISLFFIVVLAGCKSKDMAAVNVGKPAIRNNISITKLQLPYSQYAMPRLVNDDLFVLINDNKASAINAILKYNIKTKDQKIIYKTNNDIASLECNEDWLIWETDGKLYAKNMKTNKCKVLAESRDLYAPALSGNNIAWIDKTSDGRNGIVLYDLRTSNKKIVSEIRYPEFYNNFLQINDNKIVWTDIKDNAGFYYTYDLTSQRISVYESANSKYPYPGYALLAGNKIFSINFDNCQEWNWVKQQFGYLSLETRQFTPLVKDNYVNSFRVYGKRMAVIDSAQELRLYTFDGKVHQENLSDTLHSPFYSLDFAENGTLIIGYPANDKEPPSTLYLVTFNGN